MRERWHGASVAWWLGSRGRCSSRGEFPVGFSVCRLGSRYVFRYVIKFDRIVSAKLRFQVGLAVGVR